VVVQVHLKTVRFIFQVIEICGHRMGHVVPIESSKGWCFFGDIFAGETVWVIRPEEDMWATS
jgi:hypothetical protein